ncbi:MAG: glycosyltransferase family 2 protein [Clostridia bacterium]|nr:glycosyltransferase family 2 protein [Clostridia bacterium]
MSCFVSVIIPVFNAERYLKECLNSIISSHAFSDIEVLLIDDGSDDGSPEICDSFSNEHDNIRAFHVVNGGVSNARNIGIAQAKGEYITFCDADDYYLNDVLNLSVQVLKAHNPDMLFYDFIYEQSSESLKVNYGFDKNVCFKDNDRLFKYMLYHDNFNSSCNKFFKSSMIHIFGIDFKTGQKHGEDRDFVLKFLSVAETAYYLPEEGYFYRYVKSSAVNSSRTDYFDNIYYELNFKQSIGKKFNLPSELVKDISEKTAVRNAISGVFSASKSNFEAYMKSVKSLIKNQQLMDVIRANDDVVLYNFAHKKVLYYILKKQVIKCFVYIKVMELKEKLYRLIH